LNLVKAFLASQDIDILNTRAFKKDAKNFVVTVGSIEMRRNLKNIPFDGAFFDLEFGEFSGYLEEVNFYL
jgi:hypothetical protein